MVSGKTSTGFEFKVNEKVLNDWRFVTAIADSDSEDETRAMQGVTQMVRLLLDKKSEQALIKHVEDEDGIANIDAMMVEIRDIFKIIGDTNANSKK